jgi:hypothetical protein
VFIFWGRTLELEVRGGATLFCPLCRDARNLTLEEILSVPHLYAFPLGHGRNAGWSGECPTCSTRLAVDPADAEGVSISDRVRQRQALEGRVATSGISAAERADLIFEVLDAVRFELHLRQALGTIDGDARWGCGGFIAGGAVFVISSWFVLGRSTTFDEIWLCAGAVLFLGGLAANVVLRHRSPRRHARRVLLPRMIASLRHLSPSRAELEEGLKKLAALDPAVARCFTLDEFRAASPG